jgi:hypothetical protein
MFEACDWSALAEVAARKPCCVCLIEFEPSPKNAPGSLIYCSSRCAWDTEGRSQASFIRERDALSKALARSV